MCAAHFVFTVSCIANISINSTSNNTAYITSCIIFILISITICKFLAFFIATTAYIAAVSYIFNVTFFINSAIRLNSIICFTGNTTNISNINFSSNYTIS